MEKGRLAKRAEGMERVLLIASSAINNGCQNFPLNESEIKFSLFSFQLLACNSILFFLLAYQVSIFIVSCSNLSVVRQCRMQECLTFHDQVVLRFFL